MYNKIYFQCDFVIFWTLSFCQFTDSVRFADLLEMVISDSRGVKVLWPKSSLVVAKVKLALVQGCAHGNACLQEILVTKNGAIFILGSLVYLHLYSKPLFCRSLHDSALLS